jgi:hypothetical protein
MPVLTHADCDEHKGASEQEMNDSRFHQMMLRCQLGHRTEDEMIKDADTDFPEPGSSPEHS